MKNSQCKALFPVFGHKVTKKYLILQQKTMLILLIKFKVSYFDVALRALTPVFATWSLQNETNHLCNK